MKKVLSVTIALTLVMALLVGFQVSAVKNLLPATEETAGIVAGGYLPSLIINGDPIGSWSSLVEDATKIVTIDKTTKKLGNASVKIVNTKLGCSCFMLPVAGLKKNTTYTLQAWVKIDKVLSPDWGASLSADFYNFPKEPEGVQDKFLIANASMGSERYSGTKDWKRISMIFKTPNTTFTHAAMGFSLWSASGTAWFDGIALTEGKALIDDSKLENPSTSIATPTTVPDAPSSWAKAEVTEAIAAKLVPSALQSKYTSSITRSDFCDLVVNMIEVKSGKKIADFVKDTIGKDLSDKPFPDTASTNVNAASKLGIVNGRTNGNFDPSGLITRQEAAKMLALTAKALGTDITATAASFADSAKIADWAKEYVNFVFAKGVMAGTGNNNFSPAANYTREQSFLTILRLFKALK